MNLVFHEVIRSYQPGHYLKYSDVTNLNFFDSPSQALRRQRNKRERVKARFEL